MPAEPFPLLILSGPTACGKTEVGVILAERLNTEIISADSVQIFKHFNIGSAKPSEELLQRAPHHLIGTVDPEEEFNVARFQQGAMAIAADLWRRGKVPLMVGGTGLYIKAVAEGLSPAAPVSYNALAAMEEMERKGGQACLYEELKKADPRSAARIHPNDTFRTRRWLGVFLDTGMPVSEYFSSNPNKPGCDPLVLVLDPPREALYQRITARAGVMMGKGWLEEVNRLKKMGYNIKTKAMGAIGYRQIYALSEGEASAEEAVADIIKRTKAFARRQLTWFRGMEGAVFVPLDGNETAEAAAEKILRLDVIKDFFARYGIMP